MSKKPSNDRRAASGVSSEMLDAAVQLAKKQHPYEKELGRINPYTKEPITDEASYLRYLREHCYYDFCDHRIAAERAAAKQAAEQKVQNHRKGLLIVFALLLLSLIVSHIVSSNRIDRAFEDGRTSGYSDGYKVGSSDGYENGYTAGNADGHKSGYNEGKTDGYENGYYDGKADGYESGYDDGRVEGRRYSAFTYTYTGTGSTRAAPIANTYIGNRNTHKYHLPTCSYLPDQSNQVLFSSAAEAEASGYSPCQKCNP